MKLLNLAIAGLGVLAFTSCGVADRHEEISELNKESKWDEDQTNQAIDIYIEGLNEVTELYEDVLNAGQKENLEGRIDRYGDNDVIKERKKEIKEAEKNLKNVRKEIEKEYEVKEPKYGYDNSESDYTDEYNYDSDTEYTDEYDY